MQTDPFFQNQPYYPHQQQTDILPTSTGDISWTNILLTAAKNKTLWHRFLEWWRTVVSCVLAFIIYTLFAWLPNFVAFILTATLLCAFGQYDVTLKKRKIKNK
jgi:hypothetical protein